MPLCPPSGSASAHSNMDALVHIFADTALHSIIFTPGKVLNSYDFTAG